MEVRALDTVEKVWSGSSVCRWVDDGVGQEYRQALREFEADKARVMKEREDGLDKKKKKGKNK